ncbi:MAG TPA: hypothetical protein PLC27_07235 [Saprospiraceae bacterium]|nr:hypothetical protein [Saprospiraceae bacterium]MBK6664574.1 hypothetical protein [Saprospiraceae bacterium]MBK8826267.1 hypothetical protein [Saprospiraceae bacterium]MBK9584103.1 hypothetical protein [Saprospiraceae bacterium]HRG41178.1 hypothetical protein [Saprospiraceae bacterium]
MYKFCVALFCLLFATILSAQTEIKLDKIVKKDYNVLDVNIKKISDKEVEFSFPNEDILVTLDLAKVAKITFKSGRTEVYNVQEQESVTNSNSKAKLIFTTIQPNSIAVLPIPFMNTEKMRTSEEMSKTAQNDLYSKLLEKSSNIYPITIQDIRITNNLLKKSGIELSDIDQTPIEDLQKILGVDNILACKVNYTMTVSNDVVITGDDDFFSTISVEDKTFDYNIYFDLYKNNTKTYSKTRKPFFSFQDSWLDAANYLLKRSPIYND